MQGELRSKVMFEEKMDVFWELQERMRLIEFYERNDLGLEAYKQDANARQKVRFEEWIQAGHSQVYPEIAINNFRSFIFNVAISIILSVVLVISPVFIKDR